MKNRIILVFAYLLIALSGYSQKVVIDKVISKVGGERKNYY